MNTNKHKWEDHFSPIKLRNLHPNSTIYFNLYLKTDDKFVLFKEKNLNINLYDIKNLMENSIQILYINKNDKTNFKNYTYNNLKNLLYSENNSIQKKNEILYDSAINIIGDIFKNPQSNEYIQRSSQIAEYIVDLILQTPNPLKNLLKIRKPDYSTQTHSVNVCNFLVSFSKFIGVTNRETLKIIGEGGLLHDLGKSLVPSKIINKKDKLTNSEWELIIRHPADGVKIAKDAREMNEISLSIIGQHHEKYNGKGYPLGLNGSELTIFANMATIADVYDAITTNRPYSNARNETDAELFMFSHKEEFNQELLGKFFSMLSRKGD